MLEACQTSGLQRPVLQCGQAKRNHPMPYVNLQITKGATREQKARLVEEITGALVGILGKKPEHTHVVIQEIAEEDWGFAGMLTDDWKRAQGGRPGEG
ncbi:tautomerase family protein [Cognatiluteimonas lumbrici]|uniref:tautomerase family protein n=1 Tax=Cognatiluteimonas lumbrici TaxID=2559601 RepID=UPI0024823680|nr:4-oxalocrotonate tautomerase family protein [Luteimonas lumbrici]